MTTLLTWILGRLPIGWLQLKHNRTRLLAAVGGVTFANVLIFMQLGFMNALFETSVMTHRWLAADIVLVSSDFRSLREANPLPRARMFQALGVDGIESASPIYLATLQWTDPDTIDTTNFRVIGVDPNDKVFDDSQPLPIGMLKEPDTALLDRKMRDFNPAIEEAMKEKGQLEIEANNRQLMVVGLFDQGASFDVDGCMIVSDQTFLRLFPGRQPGAPTFAILRAKPGADVDLLAQQINQRLPEGDVIAFTKKEFVAAEQAYQARQTPIGFVFGFGVVMGVIVGLVIVYQVLSTDVQDHLSEYATFKAIGYSPGFFRSIVFEEAICLAALGFVPGMAISLALYRLASKATSLPVEMTWSRPIGVFVLTVIMCVASGLIAAKRLNAADPADLF